MITAPELEIAVLVLGMVILLVEAFATKIDRRILAFVAIAGLALIFVASFFVAPSASTSQATGLWSFYTADRLSIFFKQFSLLTTIVVLIMMTDYAPVVCSFFPGATPQAGLGEFFALPIFHMCRADVPRIRNRFRLHLRFAGTGDDFFLRAGQFHPAQSDRA